MLSENEAGLRRSHSMALLLQQFRISYTEVRSESVVARGYSWWRRRQEVVILMTDLFDFLAVARW